MALDESTRAQIDEAVRANPVVLFMKGRRGAPQCGFSSRVCEILDQLVPEYATHNVLEDPALREGIKEYSDWPTIPQLYVGGEFVGGCDIIEEMMGDGSLAQTLGVAEPAVAAPSLTITDGAAAALRDLAERSGGRPLHLRIDARFEHAMFFGPENPGDLIVDANGVRVCVDPMSAARAEGLTIDATMTDEGPNFRIENPQAPQAPAVNQMSVQDLKRHLDDGTTMVLYDVRTPEERATAHIEGARLFDEGANAAIAALDRDTMLVFHCHHGGRSQNAAEHFASQGFRNVWNVAGGIDAWSLEVDSSVPRY